MNVQKSEHRPWVGPFAVAVLFVAIGLVTLYMYQSTPAREADRLYVAALESLDQKRYDAAIQDFEVLFAMEQKAAEGRPEDLVILPPDVIVLYQGALREKVSQELSLTRSLIERGDWAGAKTVLDGLMLFAQWHIWACLPMEYHALVREYYRHFAKVELTRAMRCHLEQNDDAVVEALQLFRDNLERASVSQENFLQELRRDGFLLQLPNRCVPDVSV